MDRAMDIEYMELTCARSIGKAFPLCPLSLKKAMYDAVMALILSKFVEHYRSSVNPQELIRLAREASSRFRVPDLDNSDLAGNITDEENGIVEKVMKRVPYVIQFLNKLARTPECGVQDGAALLSMLPDLFCIQTGKQGPRIESPLPPPKVLSENEGRKRKNPKEHNAAMKKFRIAEALRGRESAVSDPTHVPPPGVRAEQPMSLAQSQVPVVTSSLSESIVWSVPGTHRTSPEPVPRVIGDGELSDHTRKNPLDDETSCLSGRCATSQARNGTREMPDRETQGDKTRTSIVRSPNRGVPHSEDTSEHAALVAASPVLDELKEKTLRKDAIFNSNTGKADAMALPCSKDASSSSTEMENGEPSTVQPERDRQTLACFPLSKPKREEGAETENGPAVQDHLTAEGIGLIRDRADARFDKKSCDDIDPQAETGKCRQTPSQGESRAESQKTQETPQSPHRRVTSSSCPVHNAKQSEGEASVDGRPRQSLSSNPTREDDTAKFIEPVNDSPLMVDKANLRRDPEAVAPPNPEGQTGVSNCGPSTRRYPSLVAKLHPTPCDHDINGYRRSSKRVRIQRPQAGDIRHSRSLANCESLARTVEEVTYELREVRGLREDFDRVMFQFSSDNLSFEETMRTVRELLKNVPVAWKSIEHFVTEEEVFVDASSEIQQSCAVWKRITSDCGDRESLGTLFHDRLDNLFKLYGVMAEDIERVQRCLVSAGYLKEIGSLT